MQQRTHFLKLKLNLSESQWNSRKKSCNWISFEGKKKYRKKIYFLSCRHIVREQEKRSCFCHVKIYFLFFVVWGCFFAFQSFCVQISFIKYLRSFLFSLCFQLSGRRTIFTQTHFNIFTFNLHLKTTRHNCELFLSCLKQEERRRNGKNIKSVDNLKLVKILPLRECKYKHKLPLARWNNCNNSKREWSDF